MQLDYNQSNDTFLLAVEQGVDVSSFMREHGLDFSTSSSSAKEALLFTRDPYAAAAFEECATDRALLKLSPILFEINESWRSESGAHIACPYDRELWPFQKADIEYALRRKNTLVGDQPGLGKTETAICYCNEVRAERVLVICPAQIRLQWQDRIREWSTIPRPTIYPILRGTDGTYSDAHYNIISYDLARTRAIGSALAREEYDVLIIDEPHYLKETDAQRTRAIFGGGKTELFTPLAERCASIIGLTGTPLPNRPREAYTLARGLCWDSIDWMSEDRFRERYNPSHRYDIVDPETGKSKIHIDERSGRHAELQNRLRSHFMCRHLKRGPRGVMGQLKLPIFDLINVEETEAVKQALKAESLLHIDPESIDNDIDLFGGEIATVRRMMGVAMAPQVADYIDMLMEQGEEKFLVFAWHHEVLDILERSLHDHGLIRIDGHTPPGKKKRLIDSFVEDQNVHIAIGNLLSMGTGTDGFQKVCNHALIAEADWVAGNNIQAFDRLDRGGQARQVQGDIFVAPNSISSYILTAALRKNQTIHKALDYRIGDAA
jgi:SWI/SNF-related matrix-associated actin-dependent regulator of chromatin subfamily A-like protein 1